MNSPVKKHITPLVCYPTFGENNYKPKSLKTLFAVCISYFFAFGFTSCNSSKILSRDYQYFQNNLDSVASAIQDPVIQPNDLLTIQVYSKTANQEQAAIFNLRNTAGNANAGGSLSSPSLAGYTISASGNIEMPVIGIVRAAGLTKEQLSQSLIQKLAPYVKDPSVLIRFLQYNINVLGEVKNPGVKPFVTERVTLIDAVSAAGDLTDFGRRENVLVIREQGGKRSYYSIDLRSGSVFQSPGYYLQPNDVVYVSPNKIKLKALNVDPQAQRRTGLILGIVGTLISIATLIATVSL